MGEKPAATAATLDLEAVSTASFQLRYSISRMMRMAGELDGRHQEFIRTFKMILWNFENLVNWNLATSWTFARGYLELCKASSSFTSPDCWGWKPQRFEWPSHHAGAHMWLQIRFDKIEEKIDPKGEFATAIRSDRPLTKRILAKLEANIASNVEALRDLVECPDGANAILALEEVQSLSLLSFTPADRPKADGWDAASILEKSEPMSKAKIASRIWPSLYKFSDDDSKEDRERKGKAGAARVTREMDKHRLAYVKHNEKLFIVDASKFHE